MTFLVTFTFASALILELPACLSPLAYIFATNIMERCFPITQGTWTFPIGCNGHVPDEYFPDVIKKNWLYPDLTISIWLPAAKLHNSMLSSFKAICRKWFRKISERTVGDCFTTFLQCSPSRQCKKIHYSQSKRGLKPGGLIQVRDEPTVWSSMFDLLADLLYGLLVSLAPDGYWVWHNWPGLM